MNTEPTEKQIAFLYKHGYNYSYIKTLTREEASKIIGQDIEVMKQNFEEATRDFGDDGK